MPKQKTSAQNFQISAKPMSPAYSGSRGGAGSQFRKPELQTSNLKLSQLNQQNSISQNNQVLKQSTYGNSPLFKPGQQNSDLKTQQTGGMNGFFDDSRSHITDANNISNIVADSDGQYRLEKNKQELDETIKDLDIKLNRVLMKQEYDYLKGYNIYVKRKEKELRDLIQKLSDKNQTVSFKDDKLTGMEVQLNQLRNDQMKSEKQKEELRDKIKLWKNKAEMFESEKNFLTKQTMDTKKKNKLLKVAIGRLQSEMVRLQGESDLKQKNESEIQKSQFFLTDLINLANESQSAIVTGGMNSLKQSPRLLNQSTANQFMQPSIQQLQEVSTMQFSLMENSTLLQNSTSTKAQSLHKRYQSLANTSNSNISRYAFIPTENIKFEKFVDLLYKSKMTKEEIKTEVKSYVKVVETNYNDTIKELRIQNEKLLKQLKKVQGDKTNSVIERNELESLFVDCIEDVRKDIMKRRLKNEIVQKKKGLLPLSQLDATLNKNDEDAKEFEESLIKLASLAKNKIKISDFNAKDRFNILDLFVNNEKTLIKIYEALFPHRTNKSLLTSTTSNSQNINNITQSNTNFLTNNPIKSVKALNISATSNTLLNDSKYYQTQQQQNQDSNKGNQITTLDEPQITQDYLQKLEQQQQAPSIMTSENNFNYQNQQNQTMFPKIASNTTKNNMSGLNDSMTISSKYPSLRASGNNNALNNSRL
eukprot:403350786